MTRNEIGGEFWDVPVSDKTNSLFPENTKWLSSGRIALRYVIRDIKENQTIHSVSIPSWCCSSMIKPFFDEGIEIDFYSPFASIQFQTDLVLVMDYFGYTGNGMTKNYNGLVIRDVTHSIFSASNSDSDYCFGSLRKWAGFWTGGFAWGEWSNSKQIEKSDETYIRLRMRAMEQKEEYNEGTKFDKGYLETFMKAEEILDNCKLVAASDRDIAFAHKLDVNNIKRQRKANAQVLLDAMKKVAIFPKLSDADCPLFVPIRVPDGKRDALKRFLIDRNIYCPIHWPISEFHKLDDASRQIYDEELSLVCDQRYSVIDMERICETIDDFYRTRA